MISEPEMDGAGDPAEAVDLVSHDDRAPLLGRSTARPWVWALVAVAATSAVWAGALKSTGYGHTAAPDLHGYRIDGNPCTNLSLQPLAGDLGSVGFEQTEPLIARSAVLDRAACQLIGTAGSGDGWTTSYTMTVTVDLHRKTDPGTEFDAFSHSQIPALPDNPGLRYVYTTDRRTTTHPPGLGDRANLVAGQFRQALFVQDGGAVFSLSLVGSNDWDYTVGKMPTDPVKGRPLAVETSAFRKDLVPTMRTLMRALSQPPSSS